MAPFTEACVFNRMPRSVVGKTKQNQNIFLSVQSAASETNEGISSRATKVTEAK